MASGAQTKVARIQARYGSLIDLPNSLATAEFAYAIDARRLFIGGGKVSEGSPIEGNVEILTEYSDVSSINLTSQPTSFPIYNGQTETLVTYNTSEFNTIFMQYSITRNVTSAVSVSTIDAINDVSFTTTDINTTTNEITFASPHGFTGGEKVVLSANGATPTGMFSGDIFYVDVVSPTIIKLSISDTLTPTFDFTDTGDSDYRLVSTQNVPVYNGSQFMITFRDSNNLPQDVTITFGSNVNVTQFALEDVIEEINATWKSATSKTYNIADLNGDLNQLRIKFSIDDPDVNTPIIIEGQTPSIIGTLGVADSSITPYITNDAIAEGTITVADTTDPIPSVSTGYSISLTGSVGTVEYALLAGEADSITTIVNAINTNMTAGTGITASVEGTTGAYYIRLVDSGTNTYIVVNDGSELGFTEGFDYGGITLQVKSGTNTTEVVSIPGNSTMDQFITEFNLQSTYVEAQVYNDGVSDFLNLVNLDSTNGDGFVIDESIPNALGNRFDELTGIELSSYRNPVSSLSLPVSELNPSRKIGEMKIISDGRTVSYEDDFSDFSGTGVDITVVMNAGNIDIRYTATDLSPNPVDGTFYAIPKRYISQF